MRAWLYRGFRGRKGLGRRRGPARPAFPQGLEEDDAEKKKKKKKGRFLAPGRTGRGPKSPCPRGEKERASALVRRDTSRGFPPSTLHALSRRGGRKGRRRARLRSRFSTARRSHPVPIRRSAFFPGASPRPVAVPSAHAGPSLGKSLPLEKQHLTGPGRALGIRGLFPGRDARLKSLVLFTQNETALEDYPPGPPPFRHAQSCLLNRNSECGLQSSSSSASSAQTSFGKS